MHLMMMKKVISMLNFDVEKSRSLGFTIIKNLTKQIDGELEILDLPEGFGVKINFRNDL